ncbi:MAG: hypothetical protein SF123_01650 [Chloroflexota bacterium]|nr:hypothetical protein [Chloroflexota bacterium]
MFEIVHQPLLGNRHASAFAVGDPERRAQRVNVARVCPFIAHDRYLKTAALQVLRCEPQQHTRRIARPRGQRAAQQRSAAAGPLVIEGGARRPFEGRHAVRAVGAAAARHPQRAAGDVQHELWRAVRVELRITSEQVDGGVHRRLKGRHRQRNTMLQIQYNPV